MSQLGRILVVDDEPRWLDPLRHVLTSAGYDVRAVNGGEPALASVTDGLPELILLDIRMPGMDGFEVLRRFKAREDTRDIPILLISGFAEVDERIEGLKLGAVDSVTKPFHAGELLARVRMQLELSRLRVQHKGQTAALKSVNEQLESEVARRQRVEEALQTRLVALTQPLDSLEQIRFSDLIDLEDLQQLQDQFSNATGVASVITQPDGTPITRPSNFCRLCSEIIRKTETGRRNCYQSDAVLGVPCPSGPTIQPCLSGGLWDAGASITVGGKHIANWLIGQVRNEAQDEEQILRYADEIGADREEFRLALAEVPVMSRARFEQTAQALFTFAREISSRAYQNVQQARFITERRQAEDELRKSEARLNFALETLTAGAWDLDLVDHTAHRTPLHDRIFGYETLLPAWTYEMFLEHVLPEDRPNVDRCFREATEAHSDWGFECRIRRADGDVRWIWATGSHERNAEGKPVRMSGIVQDITDRRAVEEALRENESSLATTLQSIGDGVIATDAGGRITRMNPVAERLTGWPFAEAEGRPMLEVFRIVNAATRQSVEDPVGQVMARGVTVGLANHTLLLARDGKEYQIADSAAPIRDPYGEILGVVLVFSDVTERYEAREALRRREEDYRMLFEGMLEGFALHEIICDDSGQPVDYRFLSINPAFEKMTGICAADAIGKTVRELMPEIEPVWIERYGRVAMTGEPIHFEEHSTSLGKDFHVTAYRPQPGRFAVVFNDITERKDAAQKLSLRESFLSAIIENQPGLLWLKDAAGRFLMVNKAFAEACGHEGPEEVFGLTDTDIWPKDLADKYRDDDEQLMRRGEPLMVEEEVLIGGERVWHETFKTPVRDDEGCVIGTTGYSRDVTDRKTAEVRIARLAQLYAALSQCNQAIVHSSSMEELFPKICREVVEFGGLRMAWIGLADEGTGAVCPVASYGEGMDYLKGVKASTDEREARGRGPTGTAIRENRPVWCQDFQNDPMTAPWHELGARFGWMAAAALPLHREGKTAGALVIYSDKTHVFDEEVRRLLEEMADDISFAMDSFSSEAERRRAEQALVESEETMRYIVKHDPNALAIFDNGLRYIAVSDRFLQDYNVREEDIIGRHHYEVFPEIPQEWRDVHQRCLAGAIERNDDDSFIRPDGSTTYNRWECRPWYRKGGDIGGIIMYTEVTTERKMQEEALRESEERFRLMLQHISTVSVQGYYLDGTTHYWNDASEVLYGYTAEEAIGRNLLDLIIPPEMKDGVREAIQWMGETLQPIPASELSLLRKDGSRVTVFSSHAVVKRHGCQPEFFCIDIDLTDRKLAEEALKELNSYLEEQKARAEDLAVEAQAAARAKSEFLALMSHELRTPLNGVLGFAELLSRTRLDEEQQEYTTTIIDSGNHLLDLVNDILDFSSIEKGRMQIESAPILVASLVESSCRPIRKAAADKGLEFSCVTAADVPEQITGDIRRMRQILINLLGNAIKFTARGSVVLEVAPATTEDGPALDFSVEDTGPGIAPETIGYLFKPFTQADSTVSRQFEGTGLGLAISLRLAEAMGGTLGVVSTPGKGSRFTFRFPLRDGAASATSTGNGDHSSWRDKSGGSVPVARSGNPVLVVEDDSSSRILAGKILEHLGCRAEFAANGQEAAEAFAPEKFSAILMDMQMPVMDGLEATRRIRERESGARVPIIALTANVMPGDRERCLAAGMDEVLTKPFKMAELSDVLARFLQP